MRLEGKIAIITGAGQRPGEGVGNGRATALAFAREGASVLLANRSIGSVEETRDIIRGEGFDADCIQVDVSREADCSTLIETAVAKHGRIDILHNNAGIALVDGNTADIEQADWNASLDINLTGAMLVSKHALPVMRAQCEGCITNVSSIAAIASYPVIGYKASKAALHEFTRWLAFENAAYNIRCNVLQLGLIDTPIGIEYSHAASGKPRDEVRKERAESVPMGRMGTAWETAKVALFLASDDASYITGAVLPVDGGLHTRVG
ncbi:MAG: SDR family NAD(P)-dependent oxidoreductase [Hyphomicrobiaceae bacterium]